MNSNNYFMQELYELIVTKGHKIILPVEPEVIEKIVKKKKEVDPDEKFRISNVQLLLDAQMITFNQLCKLEKGQIKSSLVSGNKYEIKRYYELQKIDPSVNKEYDSIEKEISNLEKIKKETETEYKKQHTFDEDIIELNKKQIEKEIKKQHKEIKKQLEELEKKKQQVVDKANKLLKQFYSKIYTIQSTKDYVKWLNNDNTLEDLCEIVNGSKKLIESKKERKDKYEACEEIEKAIGFDFKEYCKNPTKNLDIIIDIETLKNLSFLKSTTFGESFALKHRKRIQQLQWLFKQTNNEANIIMNEENMKKHAENIQKSNRLLLGFINSILGHCSYIVSLKNTTQKKQLYHFKIEQDVFDISTKK